MTDRVKTFLAGAGELLSLWYECETYTEEGWEEINRLENNLAYLMQTSFTEEELADLQAAFSPQMNLRHDAETAEYLYNTFMGYSDE